MKDGCTDFSWCRGASRIHLFRDEFAVRARVETPGGFSAHAGQSELIDWVRQFRTEPRIVLIRGEAEALDALSLKLWRDHRISSEIPFPGQKIRF